MSRRYSTSGWDSPPVLPLGMRLTQLKTRNTESSMDLFADLQDENESEVDFLDMSEAFSRFSSAHEPTSRSDSGIDELPTKRNLLTENSCKSSNPRVARIREFVKKYNINLSKNLKHKTPARNCNPILQNPKTSSKYRNKVLHYYHLLRGPREEHAEHPDIVKFRRFYCRRRPLSPSAPNFVFRPNFRPAPGFEDGPTSGSPTNEARKSRYFAPLASLENRADPDIAHWVRNCERKLAGFQRNCPTIDDLIDYNTGGESRCCQKLLKSLHSPKMGRSVPRIGADADMSSSDSQLGYSQNLANSPEDRFAGTIEASAASFIYGFASVRDADPATGSRHISRRYSSTSPENDGPGSPAPAADIDGGTDWTNSTVFQLREFSPKSPKQNLASIADGCPALDGGNVANSAGTGSPLIAGSRDTLDSGSRYQKNGPPFMTYPQCAASSYKYYHVPGKYPTKNEASAAGEDHVPGKYPTKNEASAAGEDHVPGKYPTKNEASAAGEKMNYPTGDSPFYFEESAPEDETEVQSKENAPSVEYFRGKDENRDLVASSESPQENPMTAAFSSAPDSFMEEISFSPEENSNANVPGDILNAEFAEASPYKIFSDDSCSSFSASDC